MGGSEGGGEGGSEGGRRKEGGGRGDGRERGERGEWEEWEREGEKTYSKGSDWTKEWGKGVAQVCGKLTST